MAQGNGYVGMDVSDVESQATSIFIGSVPSGIIHILLIQLFIFVI